MVTSRILFTATQKAELWERWRNGQSAAAISRALERKNKTGVERIVVHHGGIVPVTLMYLLMSAFHAAPWLRLISSRRSGVHRALGESTQRAVFEQVVRSDEGIE